MISKQCLFSTDSFINSGHFYSAPSNTLLLRGAPDYSTDTVSEFHAEAHKQLQAWASIVGWTEGQIPPTFWNWGTEYALSPYFLKRICVSFAVVFIAILL